METPSSMRRVTRSQTSSFSQTKSKQEEARSINNGNHERAALQDISNDSPINGVATEKTPISSVMKHGSLPKKTPGSGEALLRGQVKILLEKVEEEAELVNKLSNRHRRAPFLPFLGVLPISPALLAAPTPANTPQNFGNSKAKEEAGKDAVNGVVMGDVIMVIPKVAESVKHEEPLELHKCVVNKALLFDSPSKSEASDASSNISSSVTYQGSVVSSSYDDNSSKWSIQANASACEDDEVEYFEDFDEEDLDYYKENVEEEGCLDELCERLGKITVEDREMKKMPEFKGKHTRFIYSSDGEIEAEEEIGRVCSAGKALSPSVMLLKGLPLPEGKHLRFHEDDEE
ncbi:uncharacterized protein LOC110114576 [Dendrobium catenatum]|uniref:uncharacterized protein LOC110114576 n=1 Tax=Dendrobium catenatum TaxID=906689 RepID=UPI0009F3B7E0|nr:uncharacterized protein LOC110114576 [Dendrobium catenatum]